VCGLSLSVTTGGGVHISGIRIRIRPRRRSDYHHVLSPGVVVCDGVTMVSAADKPTETDLLREKNIVLIKKIN